MNINKWLVPTEQFYESTELRTGPGLAVAWQLPSRVCGRSLSEAKVISLRWQNMDNGRYWLWYGSIVKPGGLPISDSAHWEHYPMILQLSRAERSTTMVMPVNDHRGLPTVVLIDQKGWIVPWLVFENLTPVKVMFLAQTFDGFAFDDLHAAIALQFLEGRCRAPLKDQALYRKRLARICAA